MELLVLLDDTAGVGVLPDSAQVVHRASSRLVVVSVDERQRDQLESTPGVAAITSGALADEVVSSLTGPETQFARAFALAGTAKSRRIGDNVAWDAEGFEPPDPPPNHGERT